jgi:hypothetical protein
MWCMWWREPYRVYEHYLKKKRGVKKKREGRG